MTSSNLGLDILPLDSATARGFRSFPIPIRPWADASTAVVPLPENGSKTVSPTLVNL